MRKPSTGLAASSFKRDQKDMNGRTLTATLTDSSDILAESCQLPRQNALTCANVTTFRDELDFAPEIQATDVIYGLLRWRSPGLVKRETEPPTLQPY